jgi:thiosulfate dehydrogenase
MQDISAYMTWVSSKVADGKNLHEKGVKKLEPLEPNLENGASVYAQKCASCHQMTGQGVVVENNIIYPPLWGEHSFNIGAGMARLDTAAAFVKWNMPFGQGGTLSDQEAYDVAAYFSQQVRPDYAKKDQDWPKGEKPRDARY